MNLLSLIPWYYRAAAVAALLLAMCGWCYHKGSQNVQESWDRSILEADLKLAKNLVERGNITSRVVTKYVDRIVTIAGNTKIITKEIPKYVPIDTCSLPSGFRVLHDAAVTGSVPDPAGILNAAPVTAQDVTGTIIDNYTSCLLNREQLLSLQEWVRQQAALGSGSP